MPILSTCISKLILIPVLAFQDGRNSLIQTPGVYDLHRKEVKNVNRNFSFLASGPGIRRSLSACSVDTIGGFISLQKYKFVFKPDWIIFMVDCVTGFQYDYERT